MFPCESGVVLIDVLFFKKNIKITTHVNKVQMCNWICFIYV